MKKLTEKHVINTNDLLTFYKAKIIPNHMNTISFGLNDVDCVLFVKMTIDIDDVLTICHDKWIYILWINFVIHKQLLKKICIEY